MVNIMDKVGLPDNIDWLHFVSSSDGVEYGLHLNFMFSTWGCTFGGACPGIIYDDDETYNPPAGCCGDGAYIDGPEDYDKTAKWVQQLTYEDLEPKYLDDVRKNGWAVVRSLNPSNYQVKTRVRDGACIFANRGSSKVDGKIGCAFLHLSARITAQGVEKVSHTHTMPEVCWQLPFKRSDQHAEDGTLVSRTIYPWHVSEWYQSGEDEGGMKWWCVDDAENYSHNGEPVFRTAKNELVALMGQETYDEILPELERRYALNYVEKMRPAQPDGRSLIPLAIKGMKERPKNK